MVRACLEMLIKSTDLAKTRAIRNHFSGMANSQLLNFLDFLIECIELEEFEMVKQMANQDYAAELKRDPSLYEKVNTICEKYFEESIKQKNQMQAMLSNLLGGGGGGGMAGLGNMANALM